MLVARREERLRELADRLIEEFGVQADVIVADLADPVAPQALPTPAPKMVGALSGSSITPVLPGPIC